MIKIYFTGNWGESSTNMLKRYAKQTPKCLGKWDNLVGVDNPNIADFFIVLEGSNLNLPLDRTIYIKREPDFIQPFNANHYKHVINFETQNGGVTYWLGKTYDELSELNYPEKKKGISCIVSAKHLHRVNFIKKLFSTNVDIDLYGRGHDKKIYGESYKGELNYNGNCKYRGLIDYRYSIVMENSIQKNYWTEKIADSFLSWSIPLYWGCPNLTDYFPEKSFIPIDIKSDDYLKDVIKLTKYGIDSNMLKSLKESREMVLNEYNIWEIINKKIKNIK